ncbi:xanthine dehydrogenase family protein molybdopterin-binding subunit [Candidatus Spongiisocius sp.]|uniref:xanthine dehydrogenase family protein molybdopterin-binding subunit n=1 Tax=Candidatus Spongiisocius sp. TaxID=3101273 RepID=UPI003B59F297
MRQIGKALPRREDGRLLRGQARYMADMAFEGLLDAIVVRSPFARARILSVDASQALAAHGVVAVLTADDLVGVEPALTRQFYSLTPAFMERHQVFLGPYREPILAQDRVSRMGEPVAFLIATDRQAAEDAAELVDVDYEPLEPIVDPLRAMAPGSDLVVSDVPGNVQASFHIIVGDPGSAVEAADRKVSGRFRIGRSVGSPIENRGAVGVPATGNEPLTVWSSTQIPHILRAYVAEFLRCPQEDLRVVAPDMGGSFGGGVYAEELLVAFAARLLGQPVRWLEDRRENLANARHSRDQIIDALLAYDTSGSFRALEMRIVQDCGSANLFGLTLPFNIASHARGQFAIDHFDVTGLCVLTNKTRNTPVRGAGRPEATFVLDRLVDMAAVDLSVDPAELRRRNLIPAREMPRDMGMLYRDGAPMVYDSGDFPDQLRTALEAFDYWGERRRQREAAGSNLAHGIGVSSHVEATGLGPHETARVEIDNSGTVVLTCGSNPHGQSHATTLAQVAGEALGVRYDRIETRFGDTGLLERGGGTFGSRSAVTAGTVVHGASVELRRRILDLASEMLECDPADLIIRDGYVGPRGVPGISLSFAELATATADRAAGTGAGARLRAEDEYVPPTVTFGSGTHLASVLVDRETGVVTVTGYVVVDDCGTVLNPMVVDGQQHGGVAHGIGNALLEEAVYDEGGQLLSGTFIDYLLPTAADVPDIEVIHRPHPTPLNTLGVKGAGEGSTASAPGAIANAIADALRPLRIEINELPITPQRLVELIRAAEAEQMEDPPGN